MSDVPVTAWWLLSLWGAAAGLPVVGRRRRGGGRADAAESRAPRGRDDGGGPDPCVLSTSDARRRAAGRRGVRAPARRRGRVPALAECAAVRVALHVGLRRGIGVVRARQRRGQRRPLHEVAPRDADARRADWHRGPVRPPRGAARCKRRGVTDPGLVRACRRRRRRGVLPAVLAVRGVVVPALSPSGHPGAADPHDADPRATARRRRQPRRAPRCSSPAWGFSRRTTSSRRASEACSIFTVSRAATWPRARSPRSNCRRTPSC